jgi:hypothetical protein
MVIYFLYQLSKIKISSFSIDAGIDYTMGYTYLVCDESGGIASIGLESTYPFSKHQGNCKSCFDNYTLCSMAYSVSD